MGSTNHNDETPQGKYRVVLAPGKFRVVNPPGAAVNEEQSLKSKVVCVLEAGTEIDVLEVVKVDCEERVRGRIASPPGWLSLVNTKNGFRWVVSAGSSGVSEAAEYYGRVCEAAMRNCRALQASVGQVSKTTSTLRACDDLRGCKDLIHRAVGEVEKSNEQVLRIQKLDGHNDFDARYRKLSFDVGIAARILEHLLKRVIQVLQSGSGENAVDTFSIDKYGKDVSQLRQIYLDRTSQVGLPVEDSSDERNPRFESIGSAATKLLTESWQMVKTDPRGSQLLEAASDLLSTVSNKVEKMRPPVSVIDADL